MERMFKVVLTWDNEEQVYVVNLSGIIFLWDC